MDRNSNKPITITVRRKVRYGKNKEYEEFLKLLLEKSRNFEGYLGAEIRKPNTKSVDNIYQSIFRFKDEDSLSMFEKSTMRMEFVDNIKNIVESDGEWKKTTGLEIWFESIDEITNPQPSKIRMSLVLMVMVYVLVLSISAIFNKILPNLYYPLRLALVIVLEVLLLSYIIMPWVSRKLAWFIYKNQK